MTYSANCRNGHSFNPEKTLRSLKAVQDEAWREIGVDPDSPGEDAFCSVTLLCPTCGARVHHNGKPDAETRP